MKKSAILTPELLEAIADLKQAKTVDDLKTFTRRTFIYTADAIEIKFARAALKQSQAQLADWLGVSTQSVQAWEAGRRRPEAVVSKVIRYALKNPKWIREFADPELLKAPPVPAGFEPVSPSKKRATTATPPPALAKA